MAEQIFADEGRRYLRGNRKSPCNYAYLENPRLDAEQGRLRLRAQFTGRSGVDLFGGCLGPGDSFEVTILATPEYREGWIGLKEVEVDTNGRDGFYIRRAAKSLAERLPDEFRYPAAQEAKKMLENGSSAYRRTLSRLDVTEIRVEAEGLVLAFWFELSVDIGN